MARCTPRRSSSTDEAFEIAAKAIVSDLSAGRVVNGGDFYTFDTNVLVIIGTDWIG
ncbi:MAG: hypothetical protein ACLUW6_06365 [Coriobacteriaceae bacterium]